MSESTPVLLAGGQAPAPETTERVRALLAAGSLCALPTETVYGLAARADRPEALERLRTLKGRPKDLTFTWHVARPAALEAFPHLRPLLRRLSERYWPGPLTLVLEGAPPGLEGIARQGWTGVRMPAHPATAAMLEACDFPVVLSSANHHGEAPATRAEEVLERFGEQLDLVVDGGPCRLGEASGVLAVGRGRFQLLREGLLRLPELRRTAGLRIAFVCTGNTCRSPMAEAVARKLLQERLGCGGASGASLADFGFEVLSMGVYAASGAPASGGAIEALGQRGIELAAHRSQPATAERLLQCDRIYGLTEAHVEALRLKLPPGRHAPVELLDPEGRDIDDPLGGSADAYGRSLAAIESALQARIEHWA